MSLLECRQVTKRFGALEAVRRFSFSLEKGEILGLIGPNGSGKTTFFNVVTGIYAATSGQVSFDGRDLTSQSPQTVYRAGISRTFQRSRLWLPLSIFDNIIMGDHKHLASGLLFNLFCRRRLKAQLKESLARARELVAIFDPDLADRLFEPVANLPMIARRRIEICRALISSPKLLLLDEPSAGMTREETFSLVDDILEIKQRVDDLTIIIIEHEMSVIERITDRCVVLNFGEKIREGTYQEVTADPQVQQAYLGVD